MKLEQITNFEQNNQKFDLTKEIKEDNISYFDFAREFYKNNYGEEPSLSQQCRYAILIFKKNYSTPKQLESDWVKVGDEYYNLNAPINNTGAEEVRVKYANKIFTVPSNKTLANVLDEIFLDSNKEELEEIIGGVYLRKTEKNNEVSGYKINNNIYLESGPKEFKELKNFSEIKVSKDELERIKKLPLQNRSKKIEKNQWKRFLLENNLVNEKSVNASNMYTVLASTNNESILFTIDSNNYETRISGFFEQIKIVDRKKDYQNILTEIINTPNYKPYIVQDLTQDTNLIKLMKEDFEESKNVFDKSLKILFQEPEIYKTTPANDPIKTEMLEAIEEIKQVIEPNMDDIFNAMSKVKK